MDAHNAGCAGEPRNMLAGNVPLRTINGHLKSYKYEKILIINARTFFLGEGYGNISKT